MFGKFIRHITKIRKVRLENYENSFGRLGKLGKVIRKQIGSLGKFIGNIRGKNRIVRKGKPAILGKLEVRPKKKKKKKSPHLRGHP